VHTEITLYNQPAASPSARAARLKFPVKFDHSCTDSSNVIILEYSQHQKPNKALDFLPEWPSSTRRHKFQNKIKIQCREKNRREYNATPIPISHKKNSSSIENKIRADKPHDHTEVQCHALKTSKTLHKNIIFAAHSNTNHISCPHTPHFYQPKNLKHELKTQKFHTCTPLKDNLASHLLKCVIIIIRERLCGGGSKLGFMPA